MSEDKITQKISQLTPEQRKQLQKIINQKKSLITESATRANQQKYFTPLHYANKRNEIDDLPLSFSQERQWFFEQLNPNSCVYNIHRAVKLSGKLNIDALEKALQTIVKRHESLRTIFIEKNGKPISKIIDNVKFKLVVTDLRKFDRHRREKELDKCFNLELKEPFDLTRDLMLRGNLYLIDGNEYIFLISLHQIISDGWSLSILNNEISQLYNSFDRNKASPLTDLPLQYADYSLWQKDYFDRQKLEELLGYWYKQFQGDIPVLNLSTDRSRLPIKSFEGAKYPLSLSQDLTKQLKTLAKKLDVTLFTLLLTVLKILLYRYSGETTIVVGSPVASRNYLETEKLIGFFVKILVLKTDLSDELTFEELLAKVKTTTQSAYIHQELPYEKLIEELNIEKDLSLSPVTPILFSFQNVPDRPLSLGNLEISSYGIYKGVKRSNLCLNSFLNKPDNGTSRCDLALLLREEDRKIEGVVEYNTNLFDCQRITKLMESFRVLLKSIINNPDDKLSCL